MTQDGFSYAKLCDSCNHKPCCTDFAKPMLFPSDLDKLQQIGKSGTMFVEDIMIEDQNIKTIKKKNNSNTCIFWDEKGKMCSIYQHRPFDCRMFPFDIDYVDGEYHWIVYACKPDTDWRWAEQHLKNLESDPQFNELMENIEFFRVTAKNYIEPSKEPFYPILRKVNWKGK